MTQLQRFKSKISIAKEASWAAAQAPVIVLPFAELTENPAQEPITDTGLRGVGSRDFATVQGPGHGEFNMSGMAEPTTLGFLLLGIMGLDTPAGGAAPYTHVFTKNYSQPSFTVENDLGAGASNLALRYTGCRISELGFNFDAQNGALMYSTTMQGKSPTKVTAVNPAITTPENPYAGWQGTITSNGLTTIITSAQFTLARALDLRHTAQNSADPASLIAGPLSFEGRLTLLAEDLGDFDVWKAYTTQAFTITFTYGSAATTRTLTLTATRMNLGHGPFEIDRGNEGILFNCPFLGLHNATDGGPLKATLINARAAY